MKLWTELKRRKVIQAGAAYLVIAWVAAQVADLVLESFAAPDAAMRWLLIVLAAGFPVCLVVAWVYRITPAGLLREENPTMEAVSAQPEPRPGPAIAVLPFKNLAGSGEDDYFAEAITGDIVQGLTQSSTLTVVPVNGAVNGDDPLKLALDVNAQFVLQGTVNKSGEHLRVNARLTDLVSSSEIWSERYDRQLSAENLFAVQDDIREQLVATIGDLHGVVSTAESSRALKRPTESLTAYQCLAIALNYDKFINEDNHALARDKLEQAVKIDPNYATAWSHLSWIYTDEYVYSYNPLPDPMERAVAAAKKGIQLAPTDYFNHWLMARVHYFRGEREHYFSEAQKSLKLNDRDGTALGLIGGYMALAGDPERGLRLVEKAKTINPNYPDYYHFFFGAVYFDRGDYQAALDSLLQANNLGGWHLYLILLAATQDRLGNSDSRDQCIKSLDELLNGSNLPAVRTFLERFFVFMPELVAAQFDTVSRYSTLASS